MDITYSMPGQLHRLFINVIHACPNACLFCVDFKGDTFYGFDLKHGAQPTAEEIIGAIRRYPDKQTLREIYYCGIGEPLLRYEIVKNTAQCVRSLLFPGTVMALNTSGIFYKYHPRVDFAYDFDLIQVSLNAEDEEKYNAICRPKVQGAYQILMVFLNELKEKIEKDKLPCRVELTVVDTSDVKRLPLRERGKWLEAAPKPDVEACQKIAERFGWPLKVKSLLDDFESTEWSIFAEGLRSGNVSLRSTLAAIE